MFSPYNIGSLKPDRINTINTGILRGRHGYLTKHADLDREGVDQRLKGSSTGKETNVPYISNIPVSGNSAIKESFRHQNNVSIYRERVSGVYEVEVDRYSGILVSKKEAFTDVSRFDTKSLSVNATEFKMEDVGYWTVFGRYIPPNNDS